ncbi:MAG: response regulator, partial [Chloroflexales bacterium]|nr:response regulator [Chloroflexales bacterium]
TVWDSGIGIAAEDLPKLFQPFVQLDSRLSRQDPGTGLGLALVLRLAEAHGGSVAVESTPGQGSRFSVTLPWSPTDPPATPTQTTAASDTARPGSDPLAPKPRRARILLAEDNEATIDTLGDYLRAKGYDLFVARTGREALARAQEEQPDVILMDMHMPEIDGLETIRLLRGEAGMGAVPIIAVTALAMPGDRERCLAAGASDYLPKPVNLRTLIATIEAHRQRPKVAPRSQ